MAKRLIGLVIVAAIIFSTSIYPVNLNAQIDEEKADAFFIENYSIPISSVITVRYGDGYNNALKDIFDFLDSNDLESNNAYGEFISKYIDINSYIDFHINATYFSSMHWVEDNLIVWRLRDKEFSSKKIDSTKFHFHIGELSNDYKYDEEEIIEDILDKVQIEDQEDKATFWEDEIFVKLSVNEEFQHAYKTKLLYLMNKNFESKRLVDRINNYSMRQQILRDQEKDNISTYEYSKILDDAKDFVQGAETKTMEDASLELEYGEISRVELNGFSKLNDVRMFFYDNKFSFSHRAENSNIYLYDSDTFTIITPKDSIKGYLVYQSNKFNFISDNILEITGDGESIRVFAIKKFPHEYLFSVEGIFVVILLGILVFLIIKESRKRKRKKQELWQ